MTAADPIDEARLGLLLGDLRLPGIKHIWPRFAERADKGERVNAIGSREPANGPPPASSPPWPSTRSPNAPAAASSAIWRRRACFPARASTASTSRPCRCCRRRGSWRSSPATAGLRKVTTCSSSARRAAGNLISPAPSASVSSRTAGACSSPAPPISCRGFRSPGASSLWNPPSPSSTSITC